MNDPKGSGTIPKALDLVRAAPRVAGHALAQMLEGPRASVVVSETNLQAHDLMNFATRLADDRSTDTRRYLIFETRSGWSVVWATSAHEAWNDGVAKQLAKFSGLTAAHAGYDDDDPRGARLEFVLHTDAGLARQLSVMGGRRVSTLALGNPIEGEPERAILEKGVQNRDAAGTLRKILAGASLPDPWDQSSYIEGGAMFTIACTIGAAPIVGGLASPRSHHRTVETPPGYLAPYARKPKENGPAALLQDGAFCGHGEPRFGIWDIELSGARVLLVELPQPGDDDGALPVVRVASALRPIDFVLAYDGRCVASIQDEGASNERAATPTQPLACSACGARTFAVSVGFEIPGDSTSPEDTSWFALAVQCATCGHAQIAWDHESA